MTIAPPRTLASFIDQVGGRAACLAISRDPNAKVTVLLFPPGAARPAYVAKVPTTDTAARSVEREAAQLAEVYIASRTLTLAATSVVWRLAEGRDADGDLDILGYWLASQAPPVMQICHHLHGGMGMDIDYPMDRYYSSIKDLTLRESLTLFPLVALTILFGVYPKPVLDMSASSVQQLVNNYNTAVTAVKAAALLQ